MSVWQVPGVVKVFRDDPAFADKSAALLRQCLAEGALVACDVVWAEVATVYGERQSRLLTALNTLGVVYSEVTEESALEAARHWHTYRTRGGTRQRIAADFIVGAHALMQCDRLLTRDRGFYRSSFAALELLDPSAESSR